ncbi:MAG: glycosyltransferase family 4 protein [Deltaproteobacteria bacterium]
MKKERELLSEMKVAWLIPSMERGFCWLPVLEKLSNLFPETTVYTGLGPLDQSIRNLKFKLKIVGKTRFFRYRRKKKSHYDKGIIILSPYIIFHLLKFSPKVIFTHAFSVWTIIALLLKPFMGWRIIIAYDGSAPTVDARKSRLRLFGRKLMTLLSDSLMTNSDSGKTYLVQILKAKKELVFVRPYMVSDIKYLSQKEISVKSMLGDIKRPVFLYAGLLIQRKGLNYLIEALGILKREGCDNYTLVIVGDGPMRKELRDMVKKEGLDERVIWIGWVEYASLGSYLAFADVFVFPTLEDLWGTVVLEAMAFANPVVCSELAGSVEMVKDGENGYRFNPAHDKPEVLSNILRKFIDDPDLIQRMGEKSKKIASLHTPEAAANYMKYVIEFVLGYRDRASMEFGEYTQEQI